MAKSSRDDFTAKTKKIIAERSGYRCAFPNCRRLTTRPDPENPSSSACTGEAAHIYAAAPRGPRYNPAMTPAERKSAANGIWLCGACSTIVDSLPNTFSAETLQCFKVNAERAAVRDSQLPVYEIDSLIAEIDTLYSAMISFAHKWSESISLTDWEPGWQNRLISLGKQRNNAYLTEIHPKLIAVLEHFSATLGHSTFREDLKSGVLYAKTNNLGVVEMAEKLLRLRKQLLYR